MSSADVAIVPACEECGQWWLPGDDDRWRAEYIDEGLDQLLRFWCSECWLREFSASS